MNNYVVQDCSRKHHESRIERYGVFGRAASPSTFGFSVCDVGRVELHCSAVSFDYGGYVLSREFFVKDVS